MIKKSIKKGGTEPQGQQMTKTLDDYITKLPEDLKNVVIEHFSHLSIKNRLKLLTLSKKYNLNFKIDLSEIISSLTYKELVNFIKEKNKEYLKSFLPILFDIKPLNDDILKNDKINYDEKKCYIILNHILYNLLFSNNTLDNYLSLIEEKYVLNEPFYIPDLNLENPSDFYINQIKVFNFNILLNEEYTNNSLFLNIYNLLDSKILECNCDNSKIFKEFFNPTKYNDLKNIIELFEKMPLTFLELFIL